MMDSLLSQATEWMLQTLSQNRQRALASATPYLKLFGVASGGVWLAKGALAQSRAENGTGDEPVRTARVFAETQATQAPGLARSVIDAADILAETPVRALAG